MNILTEIITWIKAARLAAFAKKNETLFVVRRKAIGDVLWIEPVVRELSAKWKRVLVVTAYPELFENAPYTNVVFVNEKHKQFKRAAKLLKWVKNTTHFINLDSAYEKSPQQHFLHAYQQVSGLPQTEEYPKLYLSDSEKQIFAHLKPYVVIHTETFSVYNHRRVYEVDWQVVINYLGAKGFTVYVLAKDAQEYDNAIAVHTSLREMISLIYNAAFFIGIDSGPSHIAAALHVPCIIFFGAVNPWFRHFRSMFNGIIMQAYCELAGCYHRTETKKDNLFCLLVGNDGVPKCSVHSNINLLKNIDVLISQQNRQEPQMAS